MGFNENGVFEKTDYKELVKEVETVFKSSFGNDFITDISTPQGQLIAELSKLINKEEEKILKLLTMNNIDNLSGVDLDNQVMYKGLVRFEDKPANFEVNIQTDLNGSDVHIPKGAIIIRKRDDLRCELTTLVNIVAGGTLKVKAQSLDKGDIAIIQGDVFELETPNAGVTEIKSIQEGLGRLRETDVELLERYKSLQFQSGDRDRYIKSRLLEHARYVRLIDNRSLSPLEGIDVGHVGIIAHGVRDKMAFSGAIFSLLDVATPTQGNQCVKVVDSQGVKQDVCFSLATEVPIKIDIRVKNKEGYVLEPSILKEYKKKILNFYLHKADRIGQDVYLSDLMELMSDDNFFVSEIKIYKEGTANPPFVYQLAISGKEIAIFKESNISISEA